MVLFCITESQLILYQVLYSSTPDSTKHGYFQDVREPCCRFKVDENYDYGVLCVVCRVET